MMAYDASEGLRGEVRRGARAVRGREPLRQPGDPGSAGYPDPAPHGEGGGAALSEPRIRNGEGGGPGVPSLQAAGGAQADGPRFKSRGRGVLRAALTPPPALHAAQHARAGSPHHRGAARLGARLRWDVPQSFSPAWVHRHCFGGTPRVAAEAGCRTPAARPRGAERFGEGSAQMSGLCLPLPGSPDCL